MFNWMKGNRYYYLSLPTNMTKIHVGKYTSYFNQLYITSCSKRPMLDVPITVCPSRGLDLLYCVFLFVNRQCPTCCPGYKLSGNTCVPWTR